MRNFINLTKCAALLFGGMTLFACTDLSGLEERVDSLDSRITALETQVKSLNENITAINGLLNESTFITNVERTENGFSITMSDSEVYTIENGKTGDTPLITVDEEGYWRVKYGDDEYQYITDDGTQDGEKVLATAVAPIFRVTDEGYWEVSTDGGQNFDTVYLEDGHTPAQAIGKDGQDGQPGQDGEDGQDGDTFFRDVQYNEEDGILTLVLADGESYSFTVVSDFACEIEGVTYAEAEIFQPGVSRKFNVIYKGIDDVYLIVPQGWSATLEGETSPAVLTVTPPAAKTKISADSQSDVVVHAVSGDRSIFAKMKVELFDGAIPAAEVKAGAVTATEVNFTVTPNADVTSWKYMLLAASEEAPDAPEDFDTRATEVQGNTETPLKLDKDANGSALAVGTEYVLYVLAIATDEGVPTYASDIASASATPEYGSYYDMWQAGASITIAGVEYNSSNFPDATVELLQATEEDIDIRSYIHQKTGNVILFLESDGTYKFTFTSHIQATGNIILISNKEDAPVTLDPTDRYFELRAGKLVMKNITIDRSTTTTYMTNNANCTENYAALHFDSCKFTGMQNPIYAIASAKTGNAIQSIKIVNSTIELTNSNSTQLINFGACTALDAINEITFDNNIVYASAGNASGQSVCQVFNYNQKTAQAGSNWNAAVSICNNTFYNVPSSNGYIRFYQVGSMKINKNIFYSTQTSGSQSSYCFGTFSDSQSADVIDCTDNIAFGLAGNWTIALTGGTPSTVIPDPNIVTKAESDPLAEKDTENGIFTPTSSYASYGAQRN